VRSWLNTLSFGFLDKPEQGVTAERLAGAAPAPYKKEVAAMLTDMRDQGFISWNDSAQLIVGGNTLINTNLYNIISNYFVPIDGLHHARYSPTGLDEFASKVAEWQARGGRIPSAVVRAVEEVNGQKMWTARRDKDGKWVSLIQMWRVFRRNLPLAVWGITSLGYFLYVMQSMDLISFSWHSWFSSVQASMGLKHPVTASLEKVALPVLDAFDEMTNQTYRSDIQNWFDTYDKEIGTTVTTFAGSAVSTIGMGLIKGAMGVMVALATAIAGWATRRR
jgi:hypothetical protein